MFYDKNDEYSFNPKLNKNDAEVLENYDRFTQALMYRRDQQNKAIRQKFFDTLWRQALEKEELTFKAFIQLHERCPVDLEILYEKAIECIVSGAAALDRQIFSSETVKEAQEIAQERALTPDEEMNLLNAVLAGN